MVDICIAYCYNNVIHYIREGTTMTEPDIRFVDEDHRAFYMGQTVKLTPDCYHRALVYTLGINSDTRRNFDSMYNAEDRCIVPGSINAAWQTGGSVKVTRLAFNLFNGGVPTAYSGDSDADFEECKRYSVAELFCCSHAPYFIHAIRLRYPEYMRGDHL
jgi:hypothetical protein